MAEGYTRNTLSQGLGIPCWDNSPTTAVSCGDIGTYTHQNGFKKIWNLWDTGDVVRDALGITPKTQAVPWPDRVLESEAGTPVWGLGDSLAVGAEVEYTKPYSSECFYKLTTTAQDGGVLTMLAAAYRFNLTQQSQLALHNFIVHHAKALYQWTLERHGESLPLGSPIYFVTGYYKTAASAKVGFAWQSARRTLALTGKRDARKRKRVGSEQLSYHWHGGENSGNVATNIHCEDSGPQYLFLQGFSLLTYGGWDTLATPNTSGALSSCDASLAPSLASWRSPHGGLPEHVQDNSPHEFVNRILLDQTASSFALIHDDDWRFLLKGDRWDDHGIRKLLLAMDERSSVVVNNSIAHFKPGWVDDLRDDPPESHREGSAMEVDQSDDDETAGKPAKRLRPGPYPPSPTDAEFKLAENIFEAITGERCRSVPLHIATECIECTEFEKDKFRIYLNLTRGRDWGIRDGEMSIDMLVFGLRAAAYTVNAKHQVWSTLDAPGSMPTFRLVHSVETERTIVQLTFSP